MNAITNAVASFKNLTFNQKTEVVSLAIAAVAVTGYLIRSVKS